MLLARDPFLGYGRNEKAIDHNRLSEGYQGSTSNMRMKWLKRPSLGFLTLVILLVITGLAYQAIT